MNALAGAVPFADAFGCPHQRFGAAPGRQFDQGGDVEIDAAFLDRLIQRGAQGGADPVHGRRTDHPGPFHLCQQAAITGIAGVGDGLVAFVDGAEHRLHVGDAEPVQADVADHRFQVAADMGVVAAQRCRAAGLCAGEPGPQPLPGGGGGVQVRPGADLAPHLLGHRQTPVGLQCADDEVDDPVTVIGVFADGQQLVRPGDLILGGVLAGEPAAADGAAAGAVRPGR